MNLFILFEDPKKAAEAHLDKHVIKMLLEACQLLYTAHWLFAYPELLQHRSAIAVSKAQKALEVPKALKTAPSSKIRRDEPGFRPVHLHHPCAVWVRQCLGNYKWAAELACGLAEEYKYRWPGKGEHQCAAHARWLLENPPTRMLWAKRKEFVQAMEERFKDPDPIVAYRRYYRISKGQERGMLKYTRRQPPEFLNSVE